ncbi:hypothetical protein B0T25DRAFT_88903 [Lasiosphaeria hispida]|uniref:Uncharacterized protein n=1 Tax=Lasiosphaeria hispida TaxID=260671 RepID=A0AAJ0HPR2_9PEZI|nr:hypothetical protein B0T25DRAFT_88903 [Lasiosphaeria hispida]
MRGPRPLTSLPVHSECSKDSCVTTSTHTWSRVESAVSSWVGWPWSAAGARSTVRSTCWTLLASVSNSSRLRTPHPNRHGLMPAPIPCRTSPKARTTTCSAAGILASCPTIDGLFSLGLNGGSQALTGTAAKERYYGKHALRHYRSFLLWYPKLFADTHITSIACSHYRPMSRMPQTIRHASLKLAWFPLDAQNNHGCVTTH